MVRKMPILLVAAALVGCAGSEKRPAEVFGKTYSGSERFRGSATLLKNGNTTIHMTNGAGVECVGDFPYSGGQRGEGDLICNDGRIIRVTFASIGRASGYGYGPTAGGDALAFYYGLDESEADAYFGIAPSGQ